MSDYLEGYYCDWCEEHVDDEHECPARDLDGEEEQTDVSAAPPKSEVWRQVTAWCPACWWNITEQFHVAASAEQIQKAMDGAHNRQQGAGKCPNRHVRLEVFSK